MADPLKQQAKRLRDTREALEFETQVAFAKAIGVAKNTWVDFENGKRPISLGVAKKIKGRFKIGLDWTIDGDFDDLPGHLFRKLARTAA